MSLRVDDEVEDLDVGAPPRPPLSTRTRRLLLAGAVVAVAAAVAVLLVARPDDAPDRAPAAARTPVVESSAGFAAGPVLVTVNGRDALQAPGLPVSTSKHDPVVLDPAPDAVAVLVAALPNFREVRGGRIPAGSGGSNGLYLAGVYDGPGGRPVDVSLYTVPAPGTTFGTDQYVSRTRFDAEYTVRTDVAVFTGTGWWVHVVSLGPDDPSTVRTGETARLLPLAEDPRLVAR